MASCDDDFSLVTDGHQHHHHHHHHPHHVAAFPRFAPKPSPADPAAGFCLPADDHPSADHPFHDEEDPDRKSSKRKDRCSASAAGDDLSDEAGAPPSAASPYCGKKAKAPTGAGDIRKDREEWSDSAIGCLLDAYMEKFVQLNRGNLRGRDWVEVAAMVSERSDPAKACCDKQKVIKSVEQCKNKMDNLKKRYKVELQRIGNGSMAVSHWTWFKKMEQIVGSSAPVKGTAGGTAAPTPATVSDDDKSGSGGTNSISSWQNKRYVGTPSHIGIPNNMKTKSLSNPRWRRVVFRISGAALAGNGPQNVDPKVTMLIAKEVAIASRLGVEVAIVVGGRNFFCADTWVAATSLDRATAYQIGMMATVMNSILLQASLEKLGVQTRLQTTYAMHEIAEPYVKRRAIRHLEKGRVVIFGGLGAGLGSSLFTTDTAASLRASEINADALLKGTNVDGVYDCHSRNGNNVAFEHISYREFISRGFTLMDLTAISFCEENGIPVVIFNLLEPGNISRALCGDQVGTLIDQSGRMS